MIAALFALLALWSPPAAHADDKLGPAKVKFAQAAVGDSMEEKKAALDALIALADPDAAPVLTQEYVRVAIDLRAARIEQRDAEYALERREVVLANLKTLAERDKDAQNLIPREEEKIDELEKSIEKSKKKNEQLTPWRDVLVDGMARLFDVLGPARRRKSDQDIWKDAEEAPDTLERAASIELVGRIGAPGTANSIHGLLVEADVQIEKLQQRIAKAMGDVRKMEQRMQEEAEANAGALSGATRQQYEDVKKEASDATRQVHELEIFVDAARRAGGAALARESGKDLEKSMQKLVAALKKAKDRSRIDTLRMLSESASETVRAQARAMLDTETEALGIATLIDGLVGLGDKTLESALISKYLVHDAWYVRARAAHALAKLRSRAAIPALIARLETEEGRLRTDLNQALQSLTAQKFQAVFLVWQQWWKDNEASFVVPEVTADKTQLELNEEARGVTFFGITTESQRVLFVLDVSGSMEFAMVPKKNPDDDPGKKPDTPGAGEFSRLQVAKRDLLKALGGIRDGGVFNIVFFASDVDSWADGPQTMSPDVRKSATEAVEDQPAVGATNIYGALERALDLSGAKGGGTWTKPVYDTIYFLTDGRATVGVSQNTEEILSFVRERNASAGIVIHAIGLSDAHDAVLMRRLAEENGGTYVGR